MTPFKQYRRKQIAELADWDRWSDMAGVSISQVDKENGSPKVGDKIARNPANHTDRWLVAEEYFAANFEPIAQETANERGYRESLDVANKPATTGEAGRMVERLHVLVRSWRTLLTDGIWSSLTIDRDAVCNDLADAASLIERMSAGPSEEEVDRARWLTQVHTDLYDSGRVVAHCVLRWHAQTKGE